MDVRQSSTAICTSSTLSDNLMDDTSITPPSESPQHIGLPLHCSSDEYGSALNREHQRTPSTSSNGSCSSAGSKKTKGRRRVSACISLYIHNTCIMIVPAFLTSTLDASHFIVITCIGNMW